MTDAQRPDRTEQRDRLVAAYEAALTGVLQATEGLTDDAWAMPTGCPGWDVHDQLSHCVGVERRLLGDPDLDPDVEVPDLPHLTDGAGRFIERDVEARRRIAHEELRTEAQGVFDRRRQVLSELRPEQLGEEAISPLGPMRTSSALRMRIFDLSCHERDVRAALGRLEGLRGTHVAAAVEHTLRLWARALPARVEGGRTIAMRVTGRGPAVLDLASGELRHDEAATTTAAATVGMSEADVLAIASGRTDAPDVDHLEVAGHEALVRRFLAVAGITP